MEGERISVGSAKNARKLSQLPRNCKKLFVKFTMDNRFK